MHTHFLSLEGDHLIIGKAHLATSVALGFPNVPTPGSEFGWLQIKGTTLHGGGGELCLCKMERRFII